MAANTGVTLLVLLLSPWQGAELQPTVLTTGPTRTSSKSQEDIPGVFDEILVQEILERNKSPSLETQSLPPTSTMPVTKKKKARIKVNHQVSTKTTQCDDQFSARKENKLFFNEKDRETLYQIKSLAALEKIIESLRKALGHSLNRRRKKYESLFRGDRM